jgi:cellulose synthase/poly-beta-1,6-N-acetylglucosamine synthase-like glycosyltransferase
MPVLSPTRPAIPPIAPATIESARRRLTRAQAVCLTIAGLLLLALLLLQPLPALTGVVAIMTALYLINVVYRARLAWAALRRPCTIPTPPDELAALDERYLPVYTILVPVYREAGVIEALIEAIDRLDYPRRLLDVKILLEEDDAETIDAVEALVLPAHIRPVIVPRGFPKGKPRACNHGLLAAEGEYCVIFDAEDAPEPDQLKKAVLAFRKGGPETACVQAKLNYYNALQNVLTRLFTIEYSTLFDLMLPGLTAVGAPVPLGGTSNHFPTELLRRLGAWDAFNVTEDADLGIRLARRGYRTELIDSTTFEEANSQLGNWVRQRSRWIKGYLQTWLVHMRAPRRAYAELGFAGFAGFQVMILGTVLFALINPFFWALLVVWYLTHAAFVQAVYQAPLTYFAAICLFGGNLVAIYASMGGCIARREYGLVKYCLLLPLYWALMSVAAWKALLQLISKPHYWEKTRHGLTTHRAASVVVVPPRE